MSQRLFESETPDGIPVEVLGGWDNRLHYFFLVISRLDEPGGQDVETLFSNVDRDRPELSLWQITAALHNWGLAYPEAWIHTLIQDRAARVGNARKHFGRFEPKTADSEPESLLTK